MMHVIYCVSSLFSLSRLQSLPSAGPLTLVLLFPPPRKSLLGRTLSFFRLNFAILCLYSPPFLECRGISKRHKLNSGPLAQNGLSVAMHRRTLHFFFILPSKDRLSALILNKYPVKSFKMTVKLWKPLSFVNRPGAVAI